MLVRVFAILIILFGLSFLFVWTLFRTKYFSKKRAIKIAQNIGFSMFATMLALIAIGIIYNLDHSI